jgi:hypothetical protein
VQASVEHAGAQAHADQALVQVGRGPLGQAGVDRPLEGEDALGHAAGRGDDDHHEDLRLQDQHLDVPDRRRVDGRGGHDGHEVGDLRERLRGRAHGRVDLAAHELQRQRALVVGLLAQELVDEVAVAGVGGHAAG